MLFYAHSHRLLILQTTVRPSKKKYEPGKGAESGKGRNLLGGKGAAGGGVDLALLLTGTGS